MILTLNKITNRFNIRLSVAIIFSTTSLPILYAQKNSEPQARAVGRVQQELNEKDLSLKYGMLPGRIVLLKKCGN